MTTTTTITKTLIQYLAVGGAGAIGAVARLAINTLITNVFGRSFPLGTMVINLTGSFILGYFFTMAGTRWVEMSDTTRTAIAVGFVGAYTTFSTLMFDTYALHANGSTGRALLNLIGSVVLGLLAVGLGVWVAEH